MNDLFLATYVLLWIGVAFIGVVTVATLRHIALLFDAVEPIFQFTEKAPQLEPDTQLPPLKLLNADAQPAGFVRSPNAMSLIVIVSPSCDACAALLEASRDVWARSAPHGWDSHVLVLGTPQEAAAIVGRYGLTDVRVLSDPTLSAVRLWHQSVTPAAIIADERGRFKRRFTNVSAATLKQIVERSAVSIAEPTNHDLGKEAIAP